MPTEIRPKPGFLWAMFHLRCPRCREGDIFVYANPYGKAGWKHILKIHDRCPICGQPFDLEPGFWFGTSYVSYGVTIVISAITFCIWWLVVGFSLSDNRILWWLFLNALLIIGLQPWLMRLSRWLVLSFFVHYNNNWDTDDVVRLR